MLDNLPFWNLNQNELIDILQYTNKNDRPSVVNNSKLKDFLYNTTSNSFFNDVNNEFYTLDEFNANVAANYKHDRVVNKNLKILHLNIRSLNSKLDEFCNFVKTLELSFDVLVLSEIWSTNIAFYKNIIPTHNFYYDLPENSNIGGIGVFIKKDYSVQFQNNYKLKSTLTNKIENLWFEIVKNKSKYIIGCIYRHPNHHIKEFTEIMENVLSKICKHNTPCVVVGDINIDLLKVDTNASIGNYVNLLIANNFLPTLYLPTRITSSSVTLIDHMYFYNCASDKAVNISCGNLYCDISDHLPNFCILNFGKSKINFSNRPDIRLFTPNNKKLFKQELSRINWNMLFGNPVNVNEHYDIFVKKITELYNMCFPLTRMSRKAYKNKSWFSSALRNSYNQKNLLYKNWIKSGNINDKNVYLQFKKKYLNSCKTAKINYYSNLFNKQTNSMKDIWKHLNNIISNKATCSNNNSIKKIVTDNATYEDSYDIANVLNEFFCSIGGNLAKAVPLVSKCFTEYLCPSVCNSISVEYVTVNELLNLINRLDIGKASGDDGISAQLVKENCEYLVYPLVSIFNISLSSGIVPNKLKVAKVIPLYKKGTETSPANYRPISLLSVFNKLLEKIVYKRLYNFFQKENILYKYQFGFRENHSTSLAVLEVTDFCYENLEQNNYVLGLFIDLQKAFDTVDHSILLHKLYNYGVRGIMYNWIENYLFDRYQYTCINQIKSDLRQISCGVPQGSVLGPLLFLIYINDIYRATVDAKPKIFADDTNVFVIGKSLKEIELKANNCLLDIYHWCSSNKLTINIEKTCYTVFCPKSSEIVNSLDIIIGNNKVVFTSSCKYLGIIIDSKLNWKEHIDSVYKKLIKFSSIFYKIRELLPYQCLKLLYYSFIHCHILYGIEVYANTCYKNLDNLYKLNNKLIRILFNKSRDTHVKDLYSCVNSLPINLLHELQILCFVHKCVHHKELLPDIFNSYFCTSNLSCHYNSRRKNDLFVKTCSKSGRKCIVFKGSILWNNCSDVIKNNTSFISFKNMVKDTLLNNM